MFVTPAAVVLGVFVVYPIVRTLWMSLHDWSLSGQNTEWVGLENYRQLVHDGRFWNAVRVTFVYTMFAVSAQLALGLALAYRLRQTTWLSSIVRSAYFFPTIAALSTMGLVWRFILDPQIGLINAWTGAVGLASPEWLRSTTWALPAVIVVGIWKNVGLTMLVIVSALQGVPPELEEAAQLDGANAWERFRHVLVPSIRPALLFVSVINTIASLQLFDLVFSMTRGGPLFRTETLVAYMYERGFRDFRFGYAAAISWVLFVVIMLVSVVQLRVFRDADVD
ncbi:MAG: sugar ABC transporter permease [Actinomycetota bacterium]|nr:sugar ABC transporter permease [Actinomycetota bacterium]